MATDPVLLQYLESIQDTVKSIDSKVDFHAAEISSLKESRAEIKGIARTAGVISVGTAGFISWLFNLLRH